MCPPGCEQGAYERVCELRERRLDEEELVSEFTKTLEVLKVKTRGLQTMCILKDEDSGFPTSLLDYSRLLKSALAPDGLKP